MKSRDLIGYGRDRPRVTWPNGAAVAVSLVVNFEEGAEFSVEDGDPAGERVSEIQSVVPDGKRDQGTEQIFAYGMRAGLWRFLDAFAERKRRTTFYMCGRAVERVPALARAVAEAGHEAACHGWRWRPHADFPDREAERAALRRCIEVTKSATGERPLGFFCRGSESDWTRSLLVEEGFAYTSNAFDDDLPYWDEPLPGRPLLVLPYALDTNDMKFFHPNGFVRAREMAEYCGDALHRLIREGRAGCPKLLNIGFHLRISGRPARFAAVEAILDQLDNLGDAVWVAPRAEIARVWSDQFPFR